ncbi:MAG: hypothetical protein ACFCUQ_22305 [Kiloniellales bacterium]
MAESKAAQIELLIGAIARRASERRCRLTKTRLVKFLYLLDLYFAQSQGETFSGWPWAFVHYGPYCRESTDAIDRATERGILAAHSYESKFSDEDYRLYGPGEQLRDDLVGMVQSALPAYVRSHLFADVHEWCDDTFGLLDFIYFRTGPMKAANPGDLLSFQGETEIDYTQFQPVKMLPLSNTKKRTLRERLKSMKGDLKRISTTSPAPYDSEYANLLVHLDEEETPIGLSGTADVRRATRSND